MTPPGIDPVTFRFVAQYLNHCATACLKRNEYQVVSWGRKGGQCIGLTTLPPSCDDCLEFWDPQGLLMAVMGLLYLFLLHVLLGLRIVGASSSHVNVCELGFIETFCVISVDKMH
jgi:hypothetical protein